MRRQLKYVLFAGCLMSAAGCGALGFGCGFYDNGLQVAKKEFYPDALLRKYEWFKDASAALDKKQADIRVFTAELKDLVDQYDGAPRRTWAREDREQYSVLASQVAGIKASYNSLAAEYNAEMVKFNWRFTNVGDMPPGASTPLPREYKPYEER